MTTSRSATLVVRLGALLGPLTAESALAGAAGVLGWEPGWATGLVTVPVVAGPSATVALTRQWAPPWALGLILLSAFVAAVGLYESVQLSVLAASGRTSQRL